MRSSVRNIVLIFSSAFLGLFPNTTQASLMKKVEQVQDCTEFALFVENHGTTETQSLLKDAKASEGKLAQWGNWGNWNNWNNWGNFARLPQWANGWNNFLN